MNENTLTTSLGTPDTIQLDTMAGGTDIILTFEVSDRETSEDENYSSTPEIRWNGDKDSVSITKETWSD